MSRRPSLVQQVRAELLAELDRLERGAKLPNEQALAERYSVSRATVREAVLGLLEAGYVSRRHGSGTYVADRPRNRHALDSTVSYTAMIREAGSVPAVDVLTARVREATDDERERLRLGEADRVAEVERVRRADGRPVILSLDRIPEALLGDTDALDGSLYGLLEQLGHRVVRADARLVPVVADLHQAEALGVEPGEPLLHIDQLDRDADGRPVMLSAEWHVADAFDLVVNRREAT